MTVIRILTFNVFTDIPFQNQNSVEGQETLRKRDELLQNSNADVIMLQELNRPYCRQRLRKALPDYVLFSAYEHFRHRGWRTGGVSCVFFTMWGLFRFASVHYGKLLSYISLIFLALGMLLIWVIAFIILLRIDTMGLVILVRKKYQAQVLDCRPFKNRKHIVKDTFAGLWTKLEVFFQLTFISYGWMRVRTKINGRTVDLVVTHLTSPSPKSQDEQSLRYRMLQEIRRDAEVQILAGDFNTEDPDDLRPLKDLVDCHVEKGSGGGYTLDCGRNHITEYALLAGEPSHPRRVDRIYCRNCEVISCNLLDDPICSDHFGVTADLNI